MMMPALRIVPTFALAGLALLAATAAGAQSQDRTRDVVTVTGHGEARVVPDLATLHAGVTTQAKTAREASEANAKAMTAVMTAAKAGGIADNDVQTSRLSLQPVRDPNRGESRIIAFQASNQVAVKIRDLAKVSDLVDRLIGAGANDIFGIQFVVANPSKALDAAREAAIADARRKAEIYARAADVRLGPAIRIGEEEGGPPRPMPMRSMDAAAVSTPVSPGEETLHVNVTVSYELLR